uniref:Tyrosine-protein kinase ephrin type A/B receptor-like domain-containing protein n=1 Tax=Tetradesmus obliquus TaxID=3088 RepID=A0A383VUV6_TETOB|eukprot:jgi/Sobl393_1/12738/SZX68700.1
MRLPALSLLILAAVYLAAPCQAGSSDVSLVDLPLRRAMLQSQCPIQYCNSGRNCIYSSRTKKWRCTACLNQRIPNGAKSECVCPAGFFPTSDGKCSLCKDNMFCPQGQSALRSTARPCPANTVTLRRGAKSINDCFNSPGYSYRKTSDGVRAEPCGVNTWTTGLKKQTTCTACPTGFKTDPETVPGSHTNSDVCQAPAGSFVTGVSTTLCPKGEYSDDYSLATACKTCEDLYDGPGITTAREGATSAKNCTWLEPGYALMDDKKRAILTAVDLINTPISGAKKCPQNYYCPGGDPNGAGMPKRCEHGMWTEEEGASSPDECVAPPGMYLPDGVLTAEDKRIRHCPHGTYKETWQRVGIAGCLPCGVGYWLSDKTIFLNELDPNTGTIRQQIGVRGSTDSCYIQRGMGAVFERNQTTSATVLRAIICPADHYGVVGVQGTDDIWKKYGRLATPCTQCPTNMITSGDSANLKVANIQVINPTNDQQTGDFVAESSEGYYTVDSCFTKPGYGYLQGASQKCADGYWSAGGTRLPCTQCPFGRTTNFDTNINSDAANCTKYIAGFGELNSIPQLCAIGQYQEPQVNVGTACQACPPSLTTRTVGGASRDACDLCAAGWGTIALNTTCKSCQDGYYGDADRKDSACTKCPGGRSFSYDWQGVDDIFTPQTTSKPLSSSQADCVADFAQTVEGAFYLDLQYKLGAGDELKLVPARENLQSCVQDCREEAKCAAATFDYETLKCWSWQPATQESFVANGGVAFKLLSSTNLAASTKVAAQEMGSGEYSFIPDGVNTPARIATSSRNTPVATTSLRACLKACSNVNLCSGVVFGQLSGEDTIAADSCKLIMGTSLPGNSLRTLIKANFMGLNTNQVVSKGYYSQPGSTTVEICGASLTGVQGFFCPGGPRPGAAPRQQCADPNIVGTQMMAGSESAADCSGWLVAGWYWTGSAVEGCPTDHYCRGGGKYKNAGSGFGATPCPAGTSADAGTPSAPGETSIGGCNKLKAGFYYDGSGLISSSSVKTCKEGFYCETEGKVIVFDPLTATTDAEGLKQCPAGTSSTQEADNSVAGPKVINDCNRLLAGFQWEGTGTGALEITADKVNPCAADTYFGGERKIESETELMCTQCPEGTGVAASGIDTTPGAKIVNDCKKLYAGYWYNGISSGEISTTTVVPCPAGKFCTGYPIAVKSITTIGTPVLPSNCPDGTTVAAGLPNVDADAWWTANKDAREATALSTTLTSGGNGAKVNTDCKTLVAGWWFTGSTTQTVDQCPADSYCVGGATFSSWTGTSDVGKATCPTGSGSSIGAKVINDCNKLKATYYFSGGATVSGGATGSIKPCEPNFYCPGTGTNSFTVGTGAPAAGNFACPEGANSAASSDDSSDCKDLQPGWYYTGSGSISTDNVLKCPVDSYCDGTTDISVPGSGSGAAQGIASCPTGSGTVGTWSAAAAGAGSRDELNDCRRVYPGYYYYGDNTCTAGIVITSGAAICTFKLCDDPSTDSYCPGAEIASSAASSFQVNAGRFSCAAEDATRPTCDVIPGVDCSSSSQCIS